jgi:putative ABC transport system permease protein
LALSILGIALGVAVVIAIDLANGSAKRAFDVSLEAVSGRATHEILGSPSGIDESVYADLRVDLGLESIAPVVDGVVALTGEGRLVRLLGVDPFAEPPFRTRLGGMFLSGNVPLQTFLTEPRTGVLAASTAEGLGLRPGDDLDIRIGTRLESIRLVGLLAADTERERLALGDLLVVDLSVAQELLDFRGRLSRIDLLVPEGGGRERRLEEIRERLPPGVWIRPAEGRTDTMASMTRAFRLNLTALGLLAIVVGMFLIYNAMTFAVLQRRTHIGTLRALGATRRQIALAVLSEATVLGSVGTLLGVGLGIVLGSGLVRLVTTTINDLYFVLEVSRLHLSPWTIGRGVALGLGATWVAALMPAIEAARASPRDALSRSTLEARWRRGAPVAAAIGAGVVAAGAAVLLVFERSLTLSFAGIFGLIIGLSLAVPAATVVLVAFLRPVARLAAGVLGAMAARGVVAALSRTGVAISALMIAVSVTVGVGIMIDSFRQTVVRWMGRSLVADVYVSPPDLSVGNRDAELDTGLVEALRAVPGARADATVRRVELPREDGGATMLVVLGVGDDSRPSYDLTTGDFDTLWSKFRDGEGVLISEPYARRFDVGTGDLLELPTARGPHDFPILGVYYDYASDRGAVALSRSAYLAHWEDQRLSGIAFFLEDSTDITTYMDALVAAAGAERAILVQSNRAIRGEAIAIFDRTFTITAVLRLLVVIVAFVGILSALMALQLERMREFGVLRAGGMTPGQARQLVVLQTGLMGLVAGILSLPVGLLLAWLMIHVINLRAFGWTLTMQVDPLLLAQALLVSIGASVLAGLYPAWKLGSTSPALALREE